MESHGWETGGRCRKLLDLARPITRNIEHVMRARVLFVFGANIPWLCIVSCFPGQDGRGPVFTMLGGCPWGMDMGLGWFGRGSRSVCVCMGNEPRGRIAQSIPDTQGRRQTNVLIVCWCC